MEISLITEVKKRANKKKVGTHPKHPKCPECNKAIYKTMKKGASVRKTNPWAFCRNEDCIKFGLDQSKELVIIDEQPNEKPKKRETKTLDKTKEEFALVEEKNSKKAKKKKKEQKEISESGKKNKKKSSPLKKKKKAIRDDLASGKYNITNIALRNKCSRKLVMAVKAKELAKQTNEN